MLVGHTKFAPDWCFGLLKQKYHRTPVGCLADLEKLVNESAAVNYAQVVGREDGTIVVRQYDWEKFLAPYFRRQAFEGIKALHHLVFRSDQHGKAMVRSTTDGDMKTIGILAKQHINWMPSAATLPPEVTPPGLSRERRQYLFDKIREFCPDYSKDIVCPDPAAPASVLSPPSPSPASVAGPPPPSPALLSSPQPSSSPALHSSPAPPSPSPAPPSPSPAPPKRKRCRK